MEETCPVSQKAVSIMTQKGLKRTKSDGGDRLSSLEAQSLGAVTRDSSTKGHDKEKTPDVW